MRQETIQLKIDFGLGREIFSGYFGVFSGFFSGFLGAVEDPEKKG